MEVRDLKYLLAYTLPLCNLIGLTYLGGWSYLTLIITFGAIPLLEVILPGDSQNLTAEEFESKKHNKFFDLMLYGNVVIIYMQVALLIFTLVNVDLSNFEILGLILSTGILLGSNGINVAHELGHKSSSLAKFASKALLLPSLYMHFIIEHNRGHHVHIATPLDPATSRLNEYIYTFWFRSITGGYLSAWRLEAKRLTKDESSVYSYKNEMIRFAFFQVLYLGLVYYFFGLFIMACLIFVALISVLLLESINYVEHYGLVRRLNPSGRYEPVTSIHSWNSDHEVGRILLYELTRHSDHHYKANKKYQILEHYDDSPQLPFGYPGSILLALFPPLWFAKMNPVVNEWKSSSLYNSL